MTGSIINFYASGNTARGFANQFDSSVQGLERLYILNGGPGTGKTTIIRAISDHMARIGYDIWLIHCASDNGELDGVIVPDLKAGVIDGTAPREINHQLSAEKVQYIHLDAALDPSQLLVQQSAIDSLNIDIAQAYERAYSGFAEALRIHDEWETIYIANMNFLAADELTNRYIHQILYGDQKREKQSRVDHRFLGAATPRGAVDHVPNLTEGLKRYLVKGRAGSGKSTMLKKIAAAGIERGFDVEIYHCGFDPNSLDMVIVRELGFAIFDSTAPHEYFPDRSSDEIVDMYEHCINPGTDEAHASSISEIKERYSAKMKESIQHLSIVKSLNDQLAQIYIQAMNSQYIDQVKDKIQQALTSQAANSV